MSSNNNATILDKILVQVEYSITIPKDEPQSYILDLVTAINALAPATLEETTVELPTWIAEVSDPWDVADCPLVEEEPPRDCKTVVSSMNVFPSPIIVTTVNATGLSNSYTNRLSLSIQDGELATLLMEVTDNMGSVVVMDNSFAFPPTAAPTTSSSGTSGLSLDAFIGYGLVGLVVGGFIVHSLLYLYRCYKYGNGRRRLVDTNHSFFVYSGPPTRTPSRQKNVVVQNLSEVDPERASKVFGEGGSPLGGIEEEEEGGTGTGNTSGRSASAGAGTTGTSTEDGDDNSDGTHNASLSIMGVPILNTGSFSARGDVQVNEDDGANDLEGMDYDPEQQQEQDTSSSLPSGTALGPTSAIPVGATTGAAAVVAATIAQANETSEKSDEQEGSSHHRRGLMLPDTQDEGSAHPELFLDEGGTSGDSDGLLGADGDDDGDNRRSITRAKSKTLLRMGSDGILRDGKKNEVACTASSGTTPTEEYPMLPSPSAHPSRKGSKGMEQMDPGGAIQYAVDHQQRALNAPKPSVMDDEDNCSSAVDEDGKEYRDHVNYSEASGRTSPTTSSMTMTTKSWSDRDGNSDAPSPPERTNSNISTASSTGACSSGSASVTPASLTPVSLAKEQSYLSHSSSTMTRGTANTANYHQQQPQRPQPTPPMMLRALSPTPSQISVVSTISSNSTNTSLTLPGGGGGGEGSNVSSDLEQTKSMLFGAAPNGGVVGTNRRASSARAASVLSLMSDDSHQLYEDSSAASGDTDLEARDNFRRASWRKSDTQLLNSLLAPQMMLNDIKSNGAGDVNNTPTMSNSSRKSFSREGSGTSPLQQQRNNKNNRESLPELVWEDESSHDSSIDSRGRWLVRRSAKYSKATSTLESTGMKHKKPIEQRPLSEVAQEGTPPRRNGLQSSSSSHNNSTMSKQKQSSMFDMAMSPPASTGRKVFGRKKNSRVTAILQKPEGIASMVLQEDPTEGFVA